MPKLRLSCFQSAQAWLNDEPLTSFSRVKALALLIYLTIEQDRPHQRNALAGLFWPDSPEARARRNLSQTLMELRRTLGDAGDAPHNDPPFLLTTSQTIAFNPECEHQIDVADFATAIQNGDYAQAVGLYSGPFLAEFDPLDSDLFESWVETQREQLHRHALDAFRKLSQEHEQKGNLEQARKVVNQLLALAPWQEEAHAQLMRLLALAGERTAALAQYDTLSEVLMNELGVSPAEETDLLYDQILSGEIGQSSAPRFSVQSEPVQSEQEQLLHAYSIPGPPEPANPPLTGTFVGREQELTHFAEQLIVNNVTIITGMAGVGKTMVAAALAERWQNQSLEDGTAAALFQNLLSDTAPSNRRIFWHSFHAGEGVMNLVWKLAAFLAWNGQADLWQQLQKARQTGTEPPQPAVLFDYLLQLVCGQGYLLCLDDLHLLDEDPLISVLVERLKELLVQRQVALIITTRQLPPYLNFTSIKPLAGLAQSDIEQLAAARGLYLKSELNASLYSHTEGNAQLVTLALNVLEQAGDPAEALERLGEADNIERYLAKEVDDNLSEDEREVLIAVAILMGYPADREIIECISQQRRLKRTLRELTDRHLLVRTRAGDEDTYSAHAIVCTYYYDLPNRRELRGMHQRAAAYYEEELTENFQAAVHFERAGDYLKSANLISQDVWGLMTQGQVSALNLLLTRLAAHWHRHKPVTAPEEQAHIDVYIAHGQVCRFLGDIDVAQKQYQPALEKLEQLANATYRSERKAQVALGMGEALRDKSPEIALEWLERGLAELFEVRSSGAPLPESKSPAAQSISAEEQLIAALQIRAGSLHWTLGQYDLAVKCSDAGLANLSTHPSPWRALALLTIGNVYDVRGHKEPARAAWEESLEIGRQLHDLYWVTVSTGNVGIALEAAGDWARAASYYQQGIELAKQIGNMAQCARIQNLLGLLRSKQGADEEAAELLNRSLKLFRTLGIERELPYVLGSLALVQIQRQEWATAVECLAEAEAIALRLNTRYPLVEVKYLQAEVALSKGALNAARTTVDAALQLATELDLVEEIGIAQRVLGKILAAQGEYPTAITTFARSLACLADCDTYKAACTQLAWGKTLMSNGDVTEATKLLHEAQEILEDLGAQRELASLTSLMQEPTYEYQQLTTLDRR